MRYGAQRLAGTRFRGHVLVAEDNPMNRKLIQFALAPLGVTIDTTENGQQAVAKCTAREPAYDLVLMDVRMPEMDGISATRRIREIEAEQGRQRCPIVAFTGNAFNEDRQACLDAGMDDFLTKPVNFAELDRIMRTWLPVENLAPEPEAPAMQEAAELPVDRERAIGLLEKLLPLLDEHMFDAVGSFNQLKEALAGTALEANLEKIGASLETLDFDGTAQRLRKLAASQGWTLNA